MKRRSVTIVGDAVSGYNVVAMNNSMRYVGRAATIDLARLMQGLDFVELDCNKAQVTGVIGDLEAANG